MIWLKVTQILQIDFLSLPLSDQFHTYLDINVAIPSNAITFDVRVYYFSVRYDFSGFVITFSIVYMNSFFNEVNFYVVTHIHIQP